MTPGGLALGLKALGRRTRLVNIAPIRWSEARALDIARIAERAPRGVSGSTSTIDARARSTTTTTTSASATAS